jgi:RecB family exonuclease
MKITEISYSSFNEYLMCPRKYYYRKILEIPSSFTPVELAYGVGIHAGLEKFYIGKMEEDEVCLDAMMDEFEKAIDAPDVKFNGQTRDELVDEAKALMTLAMSTDVGKVIGVEYPIEVKLGKDLILTGFIDLITEEPNGEIAITDLKTAKKRFSQADLDNHAQLTTYSLAYPESELRLCVLLKQKTPAVEMVSTKRTMQQRQRLVRRIMAVRDAIEREVFYPIESYICGNCAYYEQCHKEF